MFGRKTREGLDEAQRLERHLQRLTALQQLAMEIYNDALAAAGEVVERGDEFFVRAEVEVTDQDELVEVLLPALKRKRAVVEKMRFEHGRFIPSFLAEPDRDAYDAWTAAVDALFRRVMLQIAEIERAVADTHGPRADLQSLDREEMEASLLANAATTQLTRRLGLNLDAWLRLGAIATDELRAEISLPPLGFREFKRRFMAGMAGSPMRMYI